jgi:hypothetical protein
MESAGGVHMLLAACLCDCLMQAGDRRLAPLLAAGKHAPLHRVRLSTAGPGQTANTKIVLRRNKPLDFTAQQLLPDAMNQQAWMFSFHRWQDHSRSPSSIITGSANRSIMHCSEIESATSNCAASYIHQGLGHTRVHSTGPRIHCMSL